MLHFYLIFSHVNIYKSHVVIITDKLHHASMMSQSSISGSFYRYKNQILYKEL